MVPIETLMPYLSVLLDMGNIIFFLSSLPQMWTAYKNRRKLSGLSSWMLTGYIIATVFFLTAGIITNAYFTTVLCAFNIAFFLCQRYWKWKYK